MCGNNGRGRRTMELWCCCEIGRGVAHLPAKLLMACLRDRFLYGFEMEVDWRVRSLSLCHIHRIHELQVVPVHELRVHLMTAPIHATRASGMASMAMSATVAYTCQTHTQGQQEEHVNICIVLATVAVAGILIVGHRPHKRERRGIVIHGSLVIGRGKMRGGRGVRGGVNVDEVQPKP